jgi:hypothetical protein
MNMIKHVVLLTWQEGTTEAQIAEVDENLGHLVETIDAIYSYDYGSDMGLVKGNHDYSIVAEFLTEEDFFAYAKHPEHMQFVTEVAQPIVATSNAVQFFTEELDA